MKNVIAPNNGETNPKSEYRNPKQIQRRTNLKSGKSKTPKSEGSLFEIFICFSRLKLFRISDFVLRIFCSWRLCVVARDI